MIYELHNLPTQRPLRFPLAHLLFTEQSHAIRDTPT